jgi:hypothetical protein
MTFPCAPHIQGPHQDVVLAGSGFDDGIFCCSALAAMTYILPEADRAYIRDSVS